MAPLDKKSKVYWLFFFLGLASLLPWNFFITADNYWMLKFESSEESTTNIASSNSTNTTNNNATTNVNELQTNFRSYISIFSQLPLCLCTLYCALNQSKVNEKLRVFGGLIVNTLVFILTTILVKVETSSFQQIFFWITMVSVALVNGSTAFVVSSLIGSASKLPSRYAQAAMAGQGMGGAFSAVAFIIAITVMSDVTDQALLFFSIACLVLLLAVICFYFLEKNEFYAYYKSNLLNGEEELKMIDNEKYFSEETRKNSNLKNNEPTEISLEDDQKLFSKNSDKKACEKKVQVSYYHVLSKVYVHMLSMFLVFFVTLGNFPAVAASVKSVTTGSLWSDKYFLPVACFFMFNLFDFIGRALAGVISIPSSDRRITLLLMCVLRGVFFFLFISCNAQPRTSPVLFSSDIIYILIMAMFALTNGYFATLIINYAPKFVSTPIEKQLSGTLMIFSNTCGLAAGAAFSFVATSWI